MGRLPQRLAVSVVTIGELELGCWRRSISMHGRGETPALAREADFIPVTKATLSERTRLIVSCRTAGIHRTVRLTDALLAAAGVVHGLPVVTQDADLDQIAVARPALQMLRV